MIAYSNILDKSQKALVKSVYRISIMLPIARKNSQFCVCTIVVGYLEVIRIMCHL